MKWRWEKWKQSKVLLTMQRVWWWSWAHSSVAFSEGSVWWQESQSFLLLRKRRGTIRGNLAGEDERDVPVVPATFESVPDRGTCATAGEAGLTAIRRSLGLCISYTQPILLSPSSSSPPIPPEFEEANTQSCGLNENLNSPNGPSFPYILLEG